MINHNNENLISIKEAVKLANHLSKKQISQSNISYLIQYGRLQKYKLGRYTFIDKNELKKYYKNIPIKEKLLKKELGENLDLSLSFANYTESETTKHVHRLHPYKGKFIPQLVEYFLDPKAKFFNKGDIIIDPFCGSGTTMVQANEYGINCLGIDISIFNTIISNTKIQNYNICAAKKNLDNLTQKLQSFIGAKSIAVFNKELSKNLFEFNKKYFPSYQFKRDILDKKIDDKSYGQNKVKEFLQTFQRLIKKYDIKLNQNKVTENFLDAWFLAPIRNEINFILPMISSIKDDKLKKLAMIILSRTVRSCRATTHSDLGTLKKTIHTPYYCKKHRKMCVPVLSIFKKWKQYCKDTIKRLEEFEKLKTKTYQHAITQDSRTFDIKCLEKNQELYKLLKEKKAKGIFTSPPYVGLIDYHNQHEYSYDLFNLEKKEDLEIGSMCKGQGKQAQQSYIEDISKVFINCKKFMRKDFDIFIVANDKYNLYPKIAKQAGLQIVRRYKRPVLNRIEKNRTPYSEYIFHMKNMKLT